MTAYLESETSEGSAPLLSEFRFAGRRFFLNGPDGRETLGASYDEAVDVLYLWRGDEPSEAVGIPTEDGLIVRLHPETGELVGMTLMDFRACWATKSRIALDVPQIGNSESQSAPAPAHRELVLA